MTRLPQVLVNVRTAPGQESDSPSVKRVIAAAEARLGKEGRVLVRRSGTQSLVRVMVEGEDDAVIRALADEIAQAIQGKSGS